MRKLISLAALLAIAVACVKEPTSLTITPSEVEIEQYSSYKLEATVLPADAEYAGIFWTTTNAEVATVNDNGLVQAFNPGTTVIRASTGGVTGECIVTVKEAFIPVTGVWINYTEYTVIKGESFKLEASVVPELATNKGLSFYSERPEIRCFITKGAFGSPEVKQRTIDSNMRNFFCFGLMKSLPLFSQYGLYDSGGYHMITLPDTATTQERDGTSKATGINQAFMEGYEVLCGLKQMTRISDGAEDTYLFLYNDAPHEPMLTLEPDYVPSAEIDNTEYDESHSDRYVLKDGSKIRVGSDRTVIHYHANMASLLRIGEWLDYLKQADVYDNSRIILVSDHGYYLYQSQKLLFPEHKLDYSQYVDAGNYFPLLMVKDFGEHGFRTDDSFMTNADVPCIAFEGLIDNPVNPFTGNPITVDEKYAHDQFIITEHKYWSTSTNNGTCFIASTWAAVSDNIWNRTNWKFIDERTLLKEHSIP